jgi:hypothetical protein
MIIGLQGYAGSGKSTVAKYLEERHGFARRHIKQPLREGCEVILRAAKVPESYIDRYMDGDLKRQPIPELYGITGTELQQQFGSFGRSVHPDIWLDIWSAWAAQPPKVVQESVRFANEAERCDVIWEVRRPGYGALNGHVSEALPVAEPGVILWNGGTEADLHRAIEVALAMM